MYVSQKVLDAISITIAAMEARPNDPDGQMASDILIDFANRARKEKQSKTKLHFKKNPGKPPSGS